MTMLAELKELNRLKSTTQYAKAFPKVLEERRIKLLRAVQKETIENHTNTDLLLWLSALERES